MKKQLAKEIKLFRRTNLKKHISHNRNISSHKKKTMCPYVYNVFKLHTTRNFEPLKPELIYIE